MKQLAHVAIKELLVMVSVYIRSIKEIHCRMVFSVGFYLLATFCTANVRHCHGSSGWILAFPHIYPALHNLLFFLLVCSLINKNEMSFHMQMPCSRREMNA